MDSNATAGGGVDPLLPPDSATASALQDVLWWALFVCLITGVIVSMAIVINYFRGTKEGLEQRPRVSAPPRPAVDVELAQEPVLELECSVCLSEMADGEAVRVLTACKHCFHTTCVEQWLREHATCPLCRAPTAAAAAKDRRYVPTTT